MYRVIAYIDGKDAFKSNMAHLPRVGDEIDLGHTIAIVTNIMWRLSPLSLSESPDYVPMKQGILIQMKSIPEKQGETK